MASTWAQADHHAERGTAPPRPSPLVDTGTHVLLLAGAAALTCFYLSATLETVLRTFEDDAFYYLTIARRIAAGEGSTYDGIHATNGYHPLWCFALVPLMGVFGDQPEQAVRAVGVLCVWLRFLTSVLAYHMLRQSISVSQFSAIGALALFAVANSFSTDGMEESLHMLAVLTFIAVLGARPSAALGVIVPPLLLAAVVLSRLDSGFTAVVYFCWLAWSAFHRFERRVWRGFAIEIAVFAGILGGYLAWNRAHFDTLIPISGMIKSSFPHLATAGDFWKAASLGNRALILHAFVFTAFFVCVLANRRLWRWAGWRESRTTVGIGAWSAGLCAFAVYTMVFGKWGVGFSWYYQPFAFLCALAIPFWLQVGACVLERRGFLARSRSVLSVLTALAAVAFAGRVAEKHLVRRDLTDFHIASYWAAKWVAEHLPEDTILAMNDSGTFGFFAQRPVINLDGVVNNRDYQVRLCARGIDAYLREESVQYYATHAVAPTQVRDGAYESFPCASHDSPLFECPGGSHLLHRRNEVYRFSYNRPDPTVFVIWRIMDPP